MKIRKFFILVSLSALVLTGCNKENQSQFEKLNIVTNDELKKERNKEKASLYLDSARQSLQDVSALWTNREPGNHVFSPASYLVAWSSLLAVSSQTDAYQESLCISDPKAERLGLLSSLNGIEKNNWDDDQILTSIKTAAFYQQIGNKYAFDKKKQEKLAGEYVDSGVTDVDHYLSQAQEYFTEKIGLKRQIPEVFPDKDSVLVYGGLTRKDNADLGKRSGAFTPLNGVEKTVDAVPIGNHWGTESFEYYKGENYQRRSLPICSTSLEVILPDEGTDLKDIDIKKAYLDFKENACLTPLYGYVPFFKTEERIDLTTIGDKVNSDCVVFCSELLKDDVKNDLGIRNVIQNSDFSFSDKGVEGESITRIMEIGSARPQKHPYTEFNVNRPFYAISSYGSLPLFVNQIVDPVFN